MVNGNGIGRLLQASLNFGGRASCLTNNNQLQPGLQRLGHFWSFAIAAAQKGIDTWYSPIQLNDYSTYFTYSLSLTLSKVSAKT